MGLGVTFVIATGNIDFSIGPVMYTSALIAGYCMNSYGAPLWLSMILCILIGAVFGTIGGFFVSYLHLPSFITSMSLMLVAKGVGSIFTKTQAVSWPDLSSPNGWYRYMVRAGDVPTGDVYKRQVLSSNSSRSPSNAGHKWASRMRPARRKVKYVSL